MCRQSPLAKLFQSKAPMDSFADILCCSFFIRMIEDYRYLIEHRFQWLQFRCTMASILTVYLHVSFVFFPIQNPISTYFLVIIPSQLVSLLPNPLFSLLAICFLKAMYSLVISLSLHFLLKLSCYSSFSSRTSSSSFISRNSTLNIFDFFSNPCLFPACMLSYLSSLLSLEIHTIFCLPIIFSPTYRTPISTLLTRTVGFSRLAEIGRGIQLLLLVSLYFFPSVAEKLPIPKILRIDPPGGPNTGGTAVLIHGNHFFRSKTFCKFGELGQPILPELVTSSIVVCISPPAADTNPTRVQLLITSDGGYTFSSDRISFFYSGCPL